MRDHPYAMTVVSGEVGPDQMIGDHLGLAGEAAGGTQEVASEAAQPLMINPHDARVSLRRMRRQALRVGISGPGGLARSVLWGKLEKCR